MIKLMANKNRGAEVDTSDYSFAATKKIRRLHESLDAYSPTPLLELKNFAAEKNIRALYVKDESKRFGLKAFKGLGGVWAIYKVISNELGLDNPTLAEIFTHRAELDAMTFITTTDGNHGKGVSWAAGLFGCKSFVYMPAGTVEVRAQAIRDAGSAQVQITDMNYDDCVKFTARLAQENHWHIFLQAGVGSMAGAIAAVFAEVFKENPPRVTIVEPTEVACFYETMRIGDGKIYSATGNGLRGFCLGERGVELAFSCQDF